MNRDSLIERLSTVVGIPVVPYDETGAIDHPLLADLIRRLVASGVTALTPNGNTGEFYALSPDERRAVLRTVTNAATEAPAGSAVVIGGVGLDLETAIADARFARDAGADAIMIHQPVLPYLSPEGWADYNLAVARAVPEIGVVPYLSTPLVGGAQIARLISAAPNVVALKYSVPDPVVFATVRSEVAAGTSSEVLWIAGLAESYAPAYWQGGARAFTSGLVNVVPEVSLRLLEALRRGDSASVDTLWRGIRQFEHLRARNRSADNVSVVKEAMNQLGLCRSSVRPPSAPLDEAARAEVRESIAAWDVAVAA
ncbi:dihydrodipicolinate synthase family protein [Herbiconiux sp. CPCC 203407]|uniref:Dihydrodipicolinate synthase family protein n=1 Tax=Herbiconiux oxytropis TaxID=2970915 RepID=A0AA41XCQ9_9MICO|nr:dihydrodipicolinate synthase family protein [Herbiconiux oxytropis]MCS5722911.1 dihydrodipicolinate synthase family protein [Herbiconiux oxytropis]MCS5725829.1 dihydrodipicolinate synthase family protein [Herbiconiux oxytropis]